MNVVIPAKKLILQVSDFLQIALQLFTPLHAINYPGVIERSNFS